MRYKYILFLTCILFSFACIHMHAQDNPGTAQTSSLETKAKKSKPLDKAEVMPEFPGGDKELMNFLYKNIKYPKEAVENGVQGTVVCRFVVDEEGHITNVKVKRSLDKLLDEEAVRVIESMPKWKPAKNGGKEVAVYYTLPIRFRLSSNDEKN